MIERSNKMAFVVRNDESPSSITTTSKRCRRRETSSLTASAPTSTYHRNTATAMSRGTSLLLGVGCFLLLTVAPVGAFSIRIPSPMTTGSSSHLRMSSPSTTNGETPTSGSSSKVKKLKSGGRAPTSQDRVQSDDHWEASPTDPSEARLIVLQITDVYTLENFAHFKTLIEETREKSRGAKVVCMLTGDFLSPYLLSSVDRGAGMMHALNRLPLDYLTWGNHEADIDHRTVCNHVRNFKGTWLNSNMLDHEAMDCQREYDVLEITSPDGTNTRKVGLCAVLDNDPKLYEHFEDPGAFGGATITDPWVALEKYKRLLENEKGCDLVLPLEHLYVPDDHRTCEQFDFHVVLSGHDHHRVDEVVSGTRLLKPGMNADYATVLEMSWPTSETPSKQPKIRARFVKVDDWEPDPVLAEENERAYDALIPLRNTELARIPPTFEPLTSLGSRESVCTMGKYVCTLLKSAMNSQRGKRRLTVDAVLLMGGNIRGNANYEPGSFFSLEALEAEIKEDEVVGLVPMPGWLLAEGVQATHAGEPIPGWMQYDEGVVEEAYEDGRPPVVTHVGGEPIEHDRIYRVITKITDLTNGQSPPWTGYYTEHPELLPPKGAYVNIHAKLMSYFARNLWRKIWEALSIELAENCNFMEVDINEWDCEKCDPVGRLAALDLDGDGEVTVEEMQQGLKDLLGYAVDSREMTLASFVHNFADVDRDGRVTLEDFEMFCDEMGMLYERDQWRLSYPKVQQQMKLAEQVEEQETRAEAKA